MHSDDDYCNEDNNNHYRVEAMTSDVKEVPWPFRLMKKDGLEEVFAAMSQDEQQVRGF